MNNLTLSPKAQTISPSLNPTAKQIGQEVWSIICDEFPLDQAFKTADAAHVIAKRFNYAPRTARDLVKIVLTSVLDQDWEDTPHLIRQGYFWTLPSQ